MDFKMVKYNFGFRDYIVQIWDTAGLEKYKSITKSYFHSAACIIVALDSNDEYSLAKLDKWILSIQDCLSEDSFCKIIVAVTKTDLEAKMDMEFLKIVAERYDFKYFEVSSKTGEKVNEMFEYAIHGSLVARNKIYLSKKAELFKSNNDSYLNNSPTEGNSLASNCDLLMSFSLNSLPKSDCNKEKKCLC